MNLENIEKRCKEIFDQNIIAHVTPLERKVLIELISEECPDIPRLRIAAAVDSEIKRLKEPKSRISFLSTIQHLVL